MKPCMPDLTIRPEKLGPPPRVARHTNIYRGISLIRIRAPLGPYIRIMPRALWWPYGGGLLLMSEAPLYRGPHYGP